MEGISGYGLGVFSIAVIQWRHTALSNINQVIEFTRSNQKKLVQHDNMRPGAPRLYPDSTKWGAEWCKMETCQEEPEYW